jgi:predicted NUDIX family phosphoesterase
VNQDNIDYLKTAIAKELQAKGLRKESNPDLAVNIGVVVEEEVQTRETDYQDMHYMGQRNYYWEVQELPVGKYKVGTVSIELVDTENNKVVWQDSERNVINNNPKKVQRKIEKGAARIFKNFDPSQL